MRGPPSCAMPRGVPIAAGAPTCRSCLRCLLSARPLVDVLSDAAAPGGLGSLPDPGPAALPLGLGLTLGGEPLAQLEVGGGRALGGRDRPALGQRLDRVAAAGAVVLAIDEHVDFAGAAAEHRVGGLAVGVGS